MFKYFEVNAAGHNIRCKLFYTDIRTADRAVLYCTGFAGHKDTNSARIFAEKLLSKHRKDLVIVFNWPAHGDDVKKKLDLKDCDTYLTLLIGEIRNQFGISDICCYATSFGGYLVLKYISEHGSPFRKTALRCPAVNMYDVLTGTIMKTADYEKILKGKDVLVGFDRKIIVTKALLDSLQENDIRRRDFLDYALDLLILHGTKDELVPFEDSRVFAEEQLIEFIPIEGADHRFQNPVHMSLANKYVLQFFHEAST